MLWQENSQIFTHPSKTGLWANALLLIRQDALLTANLKVRQSLIYWSTNNFTIQMQVNSQPGALALLYSQSCVTRQEPQLTTNAFLIPWTASYAKC